MGFEKILKNFLKGCIKSAFSFVILFEKSSCSATVVAMLQDMEVIPMAHSGNRKYTQPVVS